LSHLRLALVGLAATLVWTSPAAAQMFEGGVSIATSCKGSDGSYCNDTHDNLRTWGPYVGWWLKDFIEIGGRVVWLSQPDLAGDVAFPPPASFAIADRHRTIAQGEFIWHFRRGRRVRPMFGVGVGRYWDRELVTCTPPGCESIIARSGLTAGQNSESHADESVMLGLSVLLNPRVRLRGGWRYHNPFRDELALSEWFLGVGYRFGAL
jgi:hypothetical protein